MKPQLAHGLDVSDTELSLCLPSRLALNLRQQPGCRDDLLHEHGHHLFLPLCWLAWV